MSDNNGNTNGTAKDDNVVAFLKLIRWTEDYPHEINEMNYQKIYGGSTFSDFKDHPRKPVTRWGNTSTAAGAYQIVQGTWDRYSKRLGLTNFGKDAQDKVAIEIIKDCKALELIQNGHIREAFGKLNGQWTSLPGGKQSRVKADEALKKFEFYVSQQRQIRNN